MRESLNCPRCDQRLIIRHLPGGGQARACMRCHGQFVGLAIVRDYGDNDVVKRLWLEAQAHPKKAVGCPACRKAMQAVMLTPRIELDLCRPCQSMWFDPDEFNQLPPRTKSRPKPKTRQPGKKGASPMSSKNSDTPVFDTTRETLFDVLDALSELY